MNLILIPIFVWFVVYLRPLPLTSYCGRSNLLRLSVFIASFAIYSLIFSPYCKNVLVFFRFSCTVSLLNFVFINFCFLLKVFSVWRSCDLHRVQFLIIKPTRCTNFSNVFLEWNSTCFEQFLYQSSGVFHCTHSSGMFADSLRTGSG